MTTVLIALAISSGLLIVLCGTLLAANIAVRNDVTYWRLQATKARRDRDAAFATTHAQPEARRSLAISQTKAAALGDKPSAAA